MGRGSGISSTYSYQHGIISLLLRNSNNLLGVGQEFQRNDQGFLRS